MQEISFSLKARKPYRVMTNEGDYFFWTRKDARAFAKARNGFFVNDDQQLNGGDAYGVKRQENNNPKN